MRKKGQRAKRIKEKKSNSDLKIFSPAGRLIFVARAGFSIDYQELLRQKSGNRRRRT